MKHSVLIVFISLSLVLVRIPSSRCLATGKMQQRLEDTRMIFYVVDYIETDAIGIYSAGTDNKFVVLEIIMKNKLADSLSYSLFFAKLRDSATYEYGGDIAASSGLDFVFSGGRIASEDIVRGGMAFKIPSNSTGLLLQYDDYVSKFQVQLVLSLQPDPIPTSEHIPSAYVGDTVQDSRMAFSLNSYEERSSIGIWSAETGWKYLIIDVNITNVGSSDLSYNINNLGVKDSQGHFFSHHVATSALSGALSYGTLSPASRVRGRIAFQVPQPETHFVVHYNEALGSFFASHVIREFPIFFIPLLFMIATIFAAIVHRKKHTF